MTAGPVRVCALDEVPDGGAVSVQVEDRTLAVIRIDDAVYVLADRCSHENVPLSEGEVYGDDHTIECPKHGSEFDVRTGEALTLPAVKPVPTYSAFVADGDVMVELT